MSAMNEVAEPCHRASDSLANVALRSLGFVANGGQGQSRRQTEDLPQPLLRDAKPCLLDRTYPSENAILTVFGLWQ